MDRPVGVMTCTGPRATGRIPANVESRWGQLRSSLPPPVSSQLSHICRRLHLDWDDVLSVARNELSFEEAKALFLERGLAQAGPLIGEKLAGSMLGVVRIRRIPNFPPPAVVLKWQRRLWLRSDVEAYIAGKRDFAAPVSKAAVTLDGGSITDLTQLPDYLDKHLLAPLLGCAPLSVASYARAPTPQVCPQPAGYTNNVHYWTREDVIVRLAEHPTDQRPKRRPRRSSRDVSAAG